MKELRDLEAVAASEGEGQPWTLSPHSEAMYAQMVGMGLLPPIATEEAEERGVAREQQQQHQPEQQSAVASGVNAGSVEKSSATATEKQLPVPSPHGSASASVAVTEAHATATTAATTTSTSRGDGRQSNNTAAVLLPFSAAPINPNTDMFRWKAVLIGPPNTPYEGGLFELNIAFPTDYPFKPMKLNFVTSIYHPNIGTTTGHMSLNILGSDWSPALTVSKVLLSIAAVLVDPCPESPMCPSIADEYKRDRPTFNARAREWTRTHAMGIGQGGGTER